MIFDMRQLFKYFLIVFPNMSTQLYKLTDVVEKASAQAYEQAWHVFSNNMSSPVKKRLEQEVDAAMRKMALRKSYEDF